MEDKRQADKTKEIDARLLPDATPPEVKAAAPVEAVAAPEKSYIYYSPSVRMLTRGVRPSDIHVRKASRTVTATVEGVAKKITVPEGQELLAALAMMGADALKIFIWGLRELTNINGPDQVKNGRYNVQVNIPTQAFAAKCGVDVSTPSRMKDFLKRQRKALREVRSIEMSFMQTEYSGKHRERVGYSDTALIGSRTVTQNIISINYDYEFTQSAVKNNILIPLNPLCLAIDGRNPNAIFMYFAMQNQYSNANNQKKKTHDRLAVETLLKYTNLKTIEDVRKQGLSWKYHIKEFFETSLDEIYKKRLFHWEYGRPNGERISDKEMIDIVSDPNFSYEEWAAFRVYFKPVDAQGLPEGPNTD